MKQDPAIQLPRVEKSTYDGHSVWIKRPEQTRTSRFVLIHRFLARVLPTVLQPSNAVGGMQALRSEAERLTKFAELDIPAPKVLSVGDDHIILSDSGLQLRRTISKLPIGPKRMDLLTQAAKTLAKVHRCGLAHGRPHIKDMTIDTTGKIYLLDLEEDPMKIMSKHDAQARDIWLFLSSSAEFFDDIQGNLPILLNVLTQECDPELTSALKQLGKSLRPYRRIIGALFAQNISNDVTGAYHATRLLESI